jgi:hypothetical protein
MKPVSKLFGSVCVVLTVILWAVTLVIDPTQSSIVAAGSLTVIVGLAIVFSLTDSH